MYYVRRVDVFLLLRMNVWRVKENYAEEQEKENLCCVFLDRIWHDFMDMFKMDCNAVSV